jgi:4-azaleucine resistance transporter AzlC
MEAARNLQSSPVQRILRGVALALPIVMGYVPIGFAFGVLAQKNGLSLWNAGAMSIFVYAGSSQLIAVGLLGAAVPAASIIMTTFIVNLRHMLMSASLAPYLKSWNKMEISGFAYELTDESFAIHARRFPMGDTGKIETFAVNITAQLAWVGGTLLGVLAGQLITDIEPLGLDYALPAMFSALLVLQLFNRIQLAVAVFTGVASVGLALAGAGQWNVMAATVLGATLGVFLELWTKKPSFS